MTYWEFQCKPQARMSNKMKEVRPDASSINTLQSTALAGSVDRVAEPFQ